MASSPLAGGGGGGGGGGYAKSEVAINPSNFTPGTHKRPLFFQIPMGDHQSTTNAVRVMDLSRRMNLHLFKWKMDLECSKKHLQL